MLLAVLGWALLAVYGLTSLAGAGALGAFAAVGLAAVVWYLVRPPT